MCSHMSGSTAKFGAYDFKMEEKMCKACTYCVHGLSHGRTGRVGVSDKFGGRADNG